MDVTDVKNLRKFEGFDRKFRPKPFETMFPLQIFFCFFVERIALTRYGLNSRITKSDLVLADQFLVRRSDGLTRHL